MKDCAPAGSAESSLAMRLLAVDFLGCMDSLIKVVCYVKGNLYQHSYIAITSIITSRSFIYGLYYRKRVKIMNIQVYSSKFVNYEIFDETEIIAILSCHNPEVKQIQTPMSVSTH